MKKRLILLLFTGIACVSINAQKPLKKPQKRLHKTQADTIVVTRLDDKIYPVKSLTVSGTINGHGYVDLGLSVKWATCNVGASQPSDYGYYFAWGETSPKSIYSETNSVTNKKNIGDISGNSRYDAARANWGSTWRLPTIVEIEELEKKCKIRGGIYNGHKGHIVTGPNGNSIFFPAAGYRDGSSLKYVGACGRYWTSSPIQATADEYAEYFSDQANILTFFNLSNDINALGNDYRFLGRPVRPVSK